MEALFEFGRCDDDHGGIATRAGVGHICGGKLLEKGDELLVGEGVVSRDGMSASGFCEVERALARGDGGVAEVVQDVSDNLPDIEVGESGGDSGDDECVSSEWFDLEAELQEAFTFIAEESCVVRTEVERGGTQQRLAFLLTGVEMLQEAFEKNAFVGESQVYDDESVGTFCQRISISETTDETQFLQARTHA